MTEDRRQFEEAFRDSFVEPPQPPTYDELKRELEDSGRLLIRLASILTRTANALKGQPGPQTLHSWHDLPEVAAKLADEAWKYRDLSK